LPLVSPLRQSALRERDQNQASPDLDGAVDGLRVHVREHQDRSIAGVHDDRGDETVLVKARREAGGGFDVARRSHGGSRSLSTRPSRGGWR
jgi:hypothetical protein